MKERERLVVTGLVVLLLVLWLGFLFHRDPRFAGSTWGGVLAVTGSSLMLVPLAYSVVKRVTPLKRWVTARVSMRTLLTWHIYAGILGPILVVLHTGHKFDSTLGVVLTAMTLVVVLSGFVGRYLMSMFAEEITEKKKMLTGLESAYRQTAGELAAHSEQVAILRPWSGFWGRLVASLLSPRTVPAPAAARAVRLAASMADLEYAVKTHETFRRLFGRWLRVHLVISFALYGLLALHVWAAVRYGLRWLA
ncbi:MAG TPA: hypothetical protein VKE74_24480 [Gemmataceae bacterium]|nr:hypothetical protein [Gemmataceae bacterium]